MDNKFTTRADVFQFMLELYTELKKQYTLTDTGKDTYAGIYNVFLVVTDTAIYGISNNLTVTEYPSYVAKGAGADYALGCFYALYDTVKDGRELARLALEAACHFCIYCREPLDIIEVKSTDFGEVANKYKDHGELLYTEQARRGAQTVIRHIDEDNQEETDIEPAPKSRRSSSGKVKIEKAKTTGAKPKKNKSES